MLARKALAGTAAAPKVYVEDVFNTWLYTGTGSSQTITNNIDISGKGGLVWIKGRSGTTGHRFTDTARGATKSLESNSTVAEATESTGLTAFGTTGFTIGADGDYNTNTATYASWTFRKAKKFFDIVTYTGNGTAGRTISHNLGSVPGCIIIKRTSDDSGWAVYHRSLNVANNESFQLNSDIAAFTTEQYWNNTAPTSTQITLGTNATVNGNGSSYVAYIFAHDAGGFGDAGSDSIIKCSSFTCDGSGNATIDLGWEPQFVILKRKDATENWEIYDNMRGLTVSSGERLRPSASDAEVNSGETQITNTGFKRVAVAANSTYVYIAIRRGPMKTPTVGTSVFTPTARTGTGASATFTGAGFPVDSSWIRFRGSLEGTYVQDRLRGANRVLDTTSTGAQSSQTQYITAFDSMTGYTLGTNSGVNGSSSTYINWDLRRAPGFFDVVCYTGTGSNTTVSHNLGVAPELMIVKRRSASGDWVVYANNSNTESIILNLSSAATSGVWNNTSPTSSVFSVDASNTVNASGATYVAYLFASLSGVSKVGSYTGNGTSQTINCGFTTGARFVLIKRFNGIGDWFVYDTARGIVSGNDPQLKLNTTDSEATGFDAIDPDNSGFIVNQNATNFPINTNTATYIYLAIA